MNRFLSLFIFSFSYVNSFDIYNLFTRKLLYEKSVLQIHMDNIPPQITVLPQTKLLRLSHARVILVCMINWKFEL
jgi:hypothetical protein